MKDAETSLEQARIRKKESRTLDFKENIDLNSTEDWVEIVKDIVAMANSGGEIILVGVANSGQPSGADVSPLLGYDPAKITDKIAKYTGDQFADLEVVSVQRDGETVAAMMVHGVDMPMVFVRAGGYDDNAGKSRLAFAAGTIYFRHGAKSEPCLPSDIRACLERNLKRLRKEWLGNIAKVVHAPSGHEVIIQSPVARLTGDAAANRFRPTDSPDAPAFRIEDHDATYPYRLKELSGRVQAAIGKGFHVRIGHLQAVRKVYEVDKRKEFVSLSRFRSPQYSDAYVAWLTDNYTKRQQFFDDALKNSR